MSNLLQIVVECLRPSCKNIFELAHPRQKFCSKGCQRAEKQARYSKSANGREVQKRYRQTDKGRSSQLKADFKFRQNNPERVLEVYSKYAKSGKGREAYHRYLEKNPFKIQARNAVKSALRSGLLVKPNLCDECQESHKLAAHHKGYEEDVWLVVTWLCTLCHANLHKKEK